MSEVSEKQCDYSGNYNSKTVPSIAPIDFICQSAISVNVTTVIITTEAVAAINGETPIYMSGIYKNITVAKVNISARIELKPFFPPTSHISPKTPLKAPISHFPCRSYKHLLTDCHRTPTDSQ